MEAGVLVVHDVRVLVEHVDRAAEDGDRGHVLILDIVRVQEGVPHPVKARGKNREGWAVGSKAAGAEGLPAIARRACGNGTRATRAARARTS